MKLAIFETIIQVSIFYFEYYHFLTKYFVIDFTILNYMVNSWMIYEFRWEQQVNSCLDGITSIY